MRRFVVVMGLAAAVAAGIGIGALATGGGADDALGASAACSRSSLAGSYGITFEGHSSKLGRFASVSLWRFDGRGGLRASESYNSEKSGPQKRQITGKYVMHGDCTFELHFGSELVREHEAEGVCVLVANRREFSCLDNEKGWITLGTGTKM